jgi:hypothetical protein
MLLDYVIENADHKYRTLYKIHAFVEAQKDSRTVKRFFRQGEMNALLKDCRAGLKQGVEVFQVGHMFLALISD